MKNNQPLSCEKTIEQEKSRIGKFAKKNSISIDTIRYYIELHLIHPLRKGRYFYFGKEQQEQLDFIKQYKAMRFSLDEIKILMHSDKLSVLETPVKSNYIHTLLHNKIMELEEEKTTLETAIHTLKDRVEKLKKELSDDQDGMGISFHHLEMLCCPLCGKNLTIQEGQLKNHRIYSGKLQCSCGIVVTIEEGILLTSEPEKEKDSSQKQDAIRSLFQDTSYQFVEQMLYYVEEISQFLKEQNMVSKSVLIMKTGAGTFPLNLLRIGEEMGTLLLLDEDLGQLKVAKRTIERHFPDKNILYIRGQLDRLPIKLKSIDVAVDFTASFLAGIQKAKNLYGYLMDYMKEHSMIVGLYLYNNQNTLLPRLSMEQEQLLNRHYYRNCLKQHGYTQIESYAEQRLDIGKALTKYGLDSDSMNAVIDVYKK